MPACSRASAACSSWSEARACSVTSRATIQRQGCPCSWIVPNWNRQVLSGSTCRRSPSVSTASPPSPRCTRSFRLRSIPLRSARSQGRPSAARHDRMVSFVKSTRPSAPVHSTPTGSVCTACAMVSRAGVAVRRSLSLMRAHVAWLAKTAASIVTAHPHHTPRASRANGSMQQAHIASTMNRRRWRGMRTNRYMPMASTPKYVTQASALIGCSSPGGKPCMTLRAAQKPRNAWPMRPHSYTTATRGVTRQHMRRDTCRVCAMAMRKKAASSARAAAGCSSTSRGITAASSQGG